MQDDNVQLMTLAKATMTVPCFSKSPSLHVKVYLFLQCRLYLLTIQMYVYIDLHIYFIHEFALKLLFGELVVF